jgi:hypothetical protein
MMFLNLAVGLVWLALVIVPRDYSDDGIWSTVGSVLRAIFFQRREIRMRAGQVSYDGGDSLFYDGYKRQQGIWDHMDVAYFIGIVLSLLLPLYAIMRSLDLNISDIASGVSGALVTVKSDTDWASLLGQYNFSLVDHRNTPSAKNMRQNIRQQIEMDVVMYTEKLKDKSGCSCVKAEVRRTLGMALTLSLLLVNAYCVIFVMKYERRLNEYSSLIAPLALSAIDSSMPPIIKRIVLLEKHIHSLDVLRTTLHRIYMFKLLQLSAVGLSLVKIMSVYVKREDLMPRTCDKFVSECSQSCLVASLEASATRSNNAAYNQEMENGLWSLLFYDDGVAAAAGSDPTMPVCPEARLGALFLSVVCSDCLVFIFVEFARLYLVKHGVPDPFAWSGVVKRFNPKWIDYAENAGGSDPDRGKSILQRLKLALKEDAEAVKDEVIDDLKGVNDAVTGHRHGKRRVPLRKVLVENKVKHSMLAHFLSNQTFRARSRKVTKWMYLEKRKGKGRAQAWKNQSVEEWIDRFEETVLHCIAIDADTSDSLDNRQRLRVVVHQNTKRFHYWLQRFKESLIAAGIKTAGEVVEERLSETRIQRMCDGAPQCVATAILNDEGEWKDVTQIVNARRFIKADPQPFSNSYSAEKIIEILYRQAYVWIGAPFCPWLPLVAAIAQLCMFQAMKYGMKRGAYQAPKQPWSAGQIEDLFFRYALSTLLFCVVPITMWMNNEPLCGPHQGFEVFDTIGIYISEKPSSSSILGSVIFLASYLVNPQCLIIVIFVMWTRYRFADSELERVQIEFKHLQRAYARDKAFLTEECRNISAAFGPAESQRLAAAEVSHNLTEMEHSVGDELIAQMGEAYASDFKRLNFDIHDITTIQGFVDLAVKFDRNANGHIEPGTEEKRWRKYCSSASVWVGNIPVYWATQKNIQDQMEAKYGAVACCTVRRHDDSAGWLGKRRQADERSSWALVTFHSDLVAKRAKKGTLAIRGAGVFASTVTLEVAAVDDVLHSEEEVVEGVAELLNEHYTDLRNAVEAASVSPHHRPPTAYPPPDTHTHTTRSHPPGLLAYY